VVVVTSDKCYESPMDGVNAEEDPLGDTIRTVQASVRRGRRLGYGVIFPEKQAGGLATARAGM